ncbi:MAG: tRNA pseudouridine(55) synthase TruB [Candidatus Omnitrophota bacterium]
MSPDICGILIVDKEKGMTSHDVVNAVRGTFRVKKVGHAGTLDPMATGVLVILLGKATKLSATFLNQDKEYVATMKLGEKTESGDSEGKLVETRETDISSEMLYEVFSLFIGDIMQTPPMVSAKKFKGKPLYKLARKGIVVNREPKMISIKELEILEVNMPYVKFRTRCGKGTYIRQLADDIGEKLGCGAHLTELRRVRSGDFSAEQAVIFTELLKMDRDTFDENVLRV